MPDLEQRLRALAADVDWPETPDLSSVVVSRIGERPKRRGFARPRRLGVAVALALLVPAGGAVAFPSVRDDVLEWLGVKGAKVERADELPRVERRLGVEHIGRPVSLADARRLARFRVVLPAALGPPDRVRFDDATGAVVSIHGDVVLFQGRGELRRDLIGKIVTGGTRVREVDVDGGYALYVAGMPHAVLIGRPDEAETPARLASDTLLFNRGDLLVRIEAERLPLERALEIARSVR